MISTACQEWLRFARMDMESAEFLLQQHRKKVEIILYHCQQTAEKALKAYLVENNIWVGKIHDMGKLLQACRNINKRFGGKRIVDHCVFLDQYSTNVKYPFHNLPVDSSHAHRGVNSAKRVYDYVNETLGLGCYFFKRL